MVPSVRRYRTCLRREYVGPFPWILARMRVDVNHRARDSVFSAIHSLLKVVGTYTGCYVTLLAAAVPPAASGEKDYFSAYVMTSLIRAGFT